MTNRQSKPNPMDPGLAFAMLGKLVGGLVALGVAVYFIITEPHSWVVLGTIAWAWIGKGLVDSFVRDVLRVGRIEQARAARQEANTGVWRREGDGSMTVRYEPETGLYWLSGWVSLNEELDREVAYSGAAGVAEIVRSAEANGMVPGADEATTAVRARLGTVGGPA